MSNTNPAANLAATTETETHMGRMKDLVIGLHHDYAEWVGDDENAPPLEAFMDWVSDRLGDGASVAELTPEAYTDDLVARAEQAAEDAEWRAGCGPVRGIA